MKYLQYRSESTADLVIADINKKWTVEPEKLHSKSHNTVFKGMELTGKPLVTISKGVIRYDDKKIFIILNKKNQEEMICHLTDLLKK